MTPTEIARSQARAAEAAEDSGSLPEWNLDDLYAGMDDPALKRDLALSEIGIGRLRGALQGQARIARAGKSGSGAGQAVVAFEKLDELLGRIVSFAGLLHAGDTSDPARSKFYGDVAGEDHRGERPPAVLPAGAQPHRRRRAGDGDGRSGARPLPAVAGGRAQGEALPARGPRRAALPREVGDRAAAPGTGSSTRPWRRCASPSTARSCRSSRRSTCCRTRTGRSARRRPRRWPRPSRQEHPPLHPHHQHARQGQGNLRPLARLQGRRRRAPPGQPGRAGGGGGAGRGGARGLSAAVAPLLRAEGALVRPRRARPLGPQRAAARPADAGDPLRRGAGHGAQRLWRLRAGDGGDRRPLLRATAGSTRRSGRARRRAPSPIRPCRRCTPTCSSTTRARCAT